MKCHSCGVEKDPEQFEFYPYPEEEDGIIIDEPIEPFFGLDCQPYEEVPEKCAKWRRVTVCHHCFHKIHPDMWISSRCWIALNPVTPFENLPLKHAPLGALQVFESNPNNDI